MRVKTLLSLCLSFAAAGFSACALAEAHALSKPGSEAEKDSESDTSDLSYESYVQSNNRFKCLYGYAAEKTGDHESAMAIFNDCIERWEDVYSMIWLAQMYEAGVSIPQDLQRSTALMKRGAHVHDPAGYATLARYHYSKALYFGIGTEQDREEAVRWLRLAALEGLPDASEFMKQQGISGK